MNINEKIEQEYNSYYNSNKNTLSAERKITIYNVLELEKEQKLNEIAKAENIELEFMPIVINVVSVVIYLMNLVKDSKDIFKFGDLGVMLYIIFGWIVILIYLVKSDKDRKKTKQENKKTKEKIENISTKQLVIKRLALEEDNINL
ncbi:hypothetical protein [Paraclostridium sordellii]|uniref:Uncharacterized protein n=1 Tax=Paraclostridium sordellii TaxID=1505 RepID=A0A9P1PA39_PARSO|nr:hypothetical protein [Paeniclostridium sordellii]CEO32957.1 Uncharacterised protein [[Clostridium] sordellii] [Paeniclostridium sordellii]